MCGRFTLHADPEKIASQFDLPEAPVLVDRYNIAPSQPVGIVRMQHDAEDREWALVLWGLVPSWSKDPSLGAKMINARAETVPDKPSFRAPFRRRRCLVPASGFYEWQQTGKAKQPFYIRPSGADLFALAGLWDRWVGPDGSELETCTILTTDPNELMAPIHNRMPLILDPADYVDWLGSGRDDTAAHLDRLRHLFRPFPAERMVAQPVGTYVNNPRNEGPTCIGAA